MQNVDQDEVLAEREGYRLFVDPIIGLMNLFMTLVTSWIIMEVISTEHGRTLAKHLPAILSSAFKATV